MRTRPARVTSAMRKEISNILQTEIRDPRLGFVTITKVEVTPDLRYAKVFYSVLGTTGESRSTEIAIGRARGYIKKLVGDRIKLRYVPDISFHKDKGVEHSARIDALLEEIRRKREEREGR